MIRAHVKAIVLACCIAALPAHAATDEAGFTSLFDGKTLAGWHSFGQKGAAKNWTVVDGMIHFQRNRKADAQDVADLVTDKEYENFHLKLEWKMTPCADAGIMFNVQESPKYHQTWETGPEMQIADLVCTKPDSYTLYERSGDLFDLISSDIENVREAGNWNAVEIIVDHGHVRFIQNGHTTVDTTLWTPEWNALVAKTKFAKMPDFARFHKGHIALQGGEDKGVEPITFVYRNLRIKELP
ncbi:DUF1080 domain-containing protein [Luteibacter sp. UNC138MFCol5.1]|uniref:3-keto-disaccharide hydrolase n=1 Tax=Luteibacter sp. UNC138MFCol5.1 TaxID=1502774 RepID=UPI000A71BED6|nr:DUF1080 domain-containing protein [Luteibacter sp. UNC138MFCol5.1]